MTSPRIFTPETLHQKLGVHYTLNHLRRMWKRGEFPKPFKLTRRRIAWDEETLDAWIEGRIAGKEAA